MPVMMVSDVPLFVAYNGPSARFEPGVVRPVRDSLVDACLAAGARLADGGKVTPPPDDRFEDEDIERAIRTLQDDGNTKAFGADGKPKVRSIEKVLGGNIDAADRDRVWDAMNGD